MKRLIIHTLKGMVVILLAVLLTAGCGMDPLNHTLKSVVSKTAVVKNTNRSDTMLQGMTRKMMVYKQDDIIKTELRNTKIEVEKAYSDYISDGYVIYDVSAKGGLTYLSAETPGKILCVWQDFEPTYLATPDTGTAQAGGATTITLAAGASAVDDYYNGMVVELTGGTGSGQFNIITDYVGATKVATVGGTWGVNPNNTSVYKIGGYDYITAADVTIHTNVVILGVKLDDYNRITKFSNDVNIEIERADAIPVNYQDKLTFQYFNKLELDLSTWGIYIFPKIEKIYFQNVNIYIQPRGPAGTRRPVLVDCNFKNSYIKLYGLKADNDILFRFYRNTIINNCIFELETGGSGGMIRFDFYSNNGTFNNCVFIDTKEQWIEFSGDSHTEKANFNNCLFYNERVGFNNIQNDTGGIVYFNNSSIVYGRISNYLIKTIATTNGFTIGKYELDFTPIDFANFHDLTADWSHDNIDDTNYAVGYQHLDYYNAVLLNNYELPDELKKFSKDYLFVVKRDDFDADLLNATGGAFKIKNFTLYENDGTTLADFQAMENFLIKATDGTNTVVFLYMDNTIYGTIFCDIWDNTTYTITQCFQLWKVVQAQGMNNLIKQYSNPKANPKSPLGGNVRWNNWDNEVRVKQ